MSQPDAEARRKVRSRPVLRRLRNADDQYGFVLIAILVTLIAMGVASERPLGQFLIPLMFLGIFFLTLLTSGVPRRTIIVLTGIIPIVLAVGTLAARSTVGSVVASLSPLVSTALVIACVVFIFRRLATHEIITRETVFGALCVYLFAALLFALVYAIIAGLSGQAFFVQTDSPSAIDYIYFSFIAMTTVGFGDFTPALNVGKMAVIVEAISGQLYLVVVVALFVSRIGRRRRDREELDTGSTK
jgi:voltage-gated potassium channel